MDTAFKVVNILKVVNVFACHIDMQLYTGPYFGKIYNASKSGGLQLLLFKRETELTFGVLNSKFPTANISMFL